MSKKAEVTCSFIGLGLIGGSIVKALQPGISRDES